MSDYRLSDLNAVTDLVDDSLIHSRNPAGIDSKITYTDLKKSIKKTVGETITVSTDITMDPNKKYLATKPVIMTIPPAPSIGDTIEITALHGARILQNAAAVGITYRGKFSTRYGYSGYVALSAGDRLTMVFGGAGWQHYRCEEPSLQWVALSPVGLDNTGTVTVGKFSPDGRFYATGESPASATSLKLYTYDGYDTFVPVTITAIPDAITRIAWSSDSRYLAIGTNTAGARVRIFKNDLGFFTEITGAVSQPPTSVTGLAFQPGSPHLAVGAGVVFYGYFKDSSDVYTVSTATLTDNKWTVTKLEWTLDGSVCFATYANTYIGRFCFSQSAAITIGEISTAAGGTYTSNSQLLTTNEGSKVTHVRRRSASPYTVVTMMDKYESVKTSPDTGQPVFTQTSDPVPNPPIEFRLSPNKRTLLVASSAADYLTAFENRNGQLTKRTIGWVSPPTSAPSFLEWSPDSALIFYGPTQMYRLLALAENNWDIVEWNSTIGEEGGLRQGGNRLA